jgi:hypothetical protein
VNDSRLQHAINDINAAIDHRKAANAALDDARTALADVLEDSPQDEFAAALIRRAANGLNYSITGPILVTVLSLIDRAQKALARNA